MSAIKLIVGLANPGKEYINTRHNAGAWAVEHIANQTRAQLKLNHKFHGLQAETQLDDQSFQLLIPTTFMNNSGRAVQALMNFNKYKPDALLVAHDDIDLPVGSVRLKFDGGDGGHNGLRDIIKALDTKQFYRLRIGVGRPHGNREDVVDYVLKVPSKADFKLINERIETAISYLPLLLAGEMNKAMQQLHTQTPEN